MDQRRWQQIKVLLDSAVELTPERRSGFLAEACANDQSLRAEVERLLMHYEQAEDFLEGNPGADLYANIQSKTDEPAFSSGEIIAGRFRIIDLIGRGGMGEVYKAEDMRLHRIVALKFLPDDTARHPHALERFQLEAQAASALNHPNICTVYDISEESGRAFIAMEFLDGQSLKDLIAGHPLPIDRVLEISINIADALETAHGKGIIHRDIKPENIFINSRGDAKVLDFGLAKLQRREPAEAATITESTNLTQGGVAIGTVAYMSPEQARGETLDSRTDLFSLGLVMYEMATGRRAFFGATSAIIFASLLKDTPLAPSKINQSVPSDLEQIINKALEKDRALRYQHASEICSDLQGLKGGRIGATGFPANAHASKEPLSFVTSILHNWKPLVGSVSLILLLCVGWYEWLGWRKANRDYFVGREYIQLTNFVDSVTSPALSPDGRMLAMIRGDEPFLARGNVYIKLLPDGEPVQLTRDDHPKMAPVFSPDGSRIAFTRGEGWDWQTWTVPVLGGEPSELLPNASALTWTSPHEVMYSEARDDGSMKIVAANESRVNERNVYVPQNGMAHRSYLSPDSKWVLIAEMDHNGWTPCRLTAFEGGSSKMEVGPTPSQCTEAAWSPTGEWMYFAANAGKGFHLWRQRFPDGVAEQITFGATEERGIAVAPDGKSLITSVGSQLSSVWLHFRGADQQVSFQGYAYDPSLSPDSKVLFYLARQYVGKLGGELHSVELRNGHQQQLLPGIPIDHYTVSPDNQHVAFTRADGDRRGIWMWSLDRRSPPWKAVASQAYDPVFSSKGELFFVKNQGRVAYVFHMDQHDAQERKTIPNVVDHLISLSPDGNWIVASSPTGDPKNPQVVVGYPLFHGQERVLCRHCAVGGRENFAQLVSWSRDQKALYVSSGRSGSNDLPKTIVVPLSGAAFPNFLPDNFVEDPNLTKMPGVRTLDVTSVFPGPNPSMYAIWQTRTQRNLYRIGLP